MTKANNQLTTQLQPLKGQRQKGESDSAVIACCDWLRLGTGRTLPELLEKYRETPQNTAPTDSINTLQDWSKRFSWAGRATEYDADYEAIKNAERQAVIDYGLALDYERVRKLKRLATFLEQQIYEKGTSVDFEGNEINVYHNVWLPDVKQIGSGESAERVDIERFNSALIAEYRAALDDLAKEVGGRRQKTEVTGKDGGAIQTQQTNVTIQADNAHDASNILKQLADLGAIPSEPSADDNDTAPE